MEAAGGEPRGALRSEGSEDATALVTTGFDACLWDLPLIEQMHRDWFFRRHGTHWSLKDALDYLSRFLLHEPEETCFVVKFTASAHTDTETCSVELFRCKPNGVQRYGTWSVVLSEPAGRALLGTLQQLGPALGALIEKRLFLKDALQRQCLRVWFHRDVVARFFARLRSVDVLSTWLALSEVAPELKQCIVLEAAAQRSAWRLTAADLATLHVTLGDPVFTAAFAGAWCTHRNELFAQLYRAGEAVEGSAYINRTAARG